MIPWELDRCCLCGHFYKNHATYSIIRYYRDKVFGWALLQKPRHLQYHALFPRCVCVGTFTKTTPLTVPCVITKTTCLCGHFYKNHATYSIMRYSHDVFVWALLQKPRHLQHHALLPRQRVCVGTFTKTTPLTVSFVITKTMCLCGHFYKNHATYSIIRYYQDNVSVWALLQKPRHLQYHSLLPRQRVCVGTFT